MANNIPFQEMGKTVRINVSTTANTVAVVADSPCSQLRIHNGTANEIFFRCGTTSTSDVVIPTAGTPGYGTVLHNNVTMVVTAPRVPGNATPVFYVSAIAASGTGVVYVTPGEGFQ
jgi:hypothetical protein